MWMSELLMKTWRRGSAAPWQMAAQPCSTSVGTARQRVAMEVPRTSLGDAGDGVEVAGAGGGEAGLDNSRR